MHNYGKMPILPIGYVRHRSFYRYQSKKRSNVAHFAIVVSCMVFSIYLMKTERLLQTVCCKRNQPHPQNCQEE